MIRAVALLGLAIGLAGGCGHARSAPPSAAVAPTKPDHEVSAETGVPVASTPQGLLHDGGEKKIQERLHAKGLLRAEDCTGRFDPATRDALREFQKHEGLPTTGLVSYETVEHLGLKLDTIFRSTAHPEEPPRRPASAR